MWTVFIWFYIFLFAINGMMLFVDASLPAFSLTSPLDNSTITPPAQPNVTGVFDNSSSTNPTNSTNPSSSIGIWDTVNYAWNQTIFFVNLLTGGFVWSALGVFGLPDVVFQTIQGIVALFGGLTLLHFWRGIL